MPSAQHAQRWATASDVTANNLDSNQELTPPPPCPTYRLTEEKAQTAASWAGWRRG